MSIKVSDLKSKINEREKSLKSQAIEIYNKEPGKFVCIANIFDSLIDKDAELLELHNTLREILRAENEANQKAIEQAKIKVMSEFEYLGFYSDGPTCANTYSGYSHHDHLYRNRETGKYLLSPIMMWEHSYGFFYNGKKIKL